MPYLLLRRRRCGSLAAAIFVILGTPPVSTPLAAQWLKYPTAGVPRKADGKVDMLSPAPRMADGKPDFSGIWTTGEPFDRRALGLSSPKDLAAPKNPQSSSEPQGPGDPTAIVGSRQMANIGIDLPGGLPYQPWLVPIVKERTDNLAKDDPHVRCLPDNFIRAYGMPHLLKFVHHPGLLVVLAEMNAGYRQVFTDARPLPKDPNPTLQGYSSGKWVGDTLVIDTIGLRDDTWIDWSGSVVTEAAKVREQIRRPDFGHLEIQVTVDDPKAGVFLPWCILSQCCTWFIDATKRSPLSLSPFWARPCYRLIWPLSGSITPLPEYRERLMARWTCLPPRPGWRMASPIFPESGPPENPM
jgi:hypothetical protein